MGFFFTLTSFGEMIVANKFLPFIVEKSPLHSIYQTMLSRSKGINTITFLNVFLAVGKHGIKKVREFVYSRSEKMDTNDLYQAISNCFGDGFNAEDYKAFNLLKYSMSLEELTEKDTKFNEYGYSDILGFIFVVAILGKSSEYFNNDYENYLKNYPHVMENLKKFMTFDEEDPGVVIDVETKDELVSKIFYHSLISHDPSYTYKIRKVVSTKTKTPPWESKGPEPAYREGEDPRTDAPEVPF